MSLTGALALLLGLSAVQLSWARTPMCGQAEPWTVSGGYNPVMAARGNITLVALLKATRPFCLQQASSLEALLLKLRARNLSDVQFLVVNSLDSAAEVRELERRVSFPVYQETANEPVWSVLEGDKDDVFIYDRCGRLSYFIPFPLSVTLPGRHPVVEEALNTTYYASPGGDFCPQDPSAIPHGSSPQEHQQQRIPGQIETQDEGETGNTVSPPTTPSEGLGWRVIHMVFGDGHQDHINSHTPSQAQEGGVTTGAPHDHQERHPTPTECVSINKAICFDWPKERIRHVESCCNHDRSVPGAITFRHSCPATDAPTVQEAAPRLLVLQAPARGPGSADLPRVRRRPDFA
uniref:Putative selenoprotein p ixodes scapularis selenoprotein p n=1 Tax=Ixodes ricinus TaxID=34613 RepID=A0A090X7U9_IXORI